MKNGRLVADACVVLRSGRELSIMSNIAYQSISSGFVRCTGRLLLRPSIAGAFGWLVAVIIIAGAFISYYGVHKPLFLACS